MARIVEAIGRWRSGELSCGEAAQVLGMSERHFRRLRDRCRAGEFPTRELAPRVVELRKRYLLLSIPIERWRAGAP